MQKFTSLLRKATIFVLSLIGSEWVEPKAFSSFGVWNGMSLKLHRTEGDGLNAKVRVSFLSESKRNFMSKCRIWTLYSVSFIKLTLGFKVLP